MPLRERTRARKVLVVIGALVLVGGAATISALVMTRGNAGPRSPASPTAATGVAPGSFRCDPPVPAPAILGTSNRPVALVYDFKPGERTDVTATFTTSSRSVTPEGARSETQTVSAAEQLQWLNVLDGSSNGELTIAKLAIDRTSERGAQRASIHWRSEDATTDRGNPEMIAMRSLIGQPFAFGVTAHGRWTADEVFQALLVAKGLTPQQGAPVTASVLFRAMFVELPETLRTGDAVPAGELRALLPSGYGEIATKLALRVAAVAGDRVLLVVDPTLDVDFTGAIEMTEAHAALAGWYVFDRERQEIETSALRVCTHHVMKLDGVPVDATSEISWTHESKTYAFAIQTPGGR